jgi:hypothetical protein
MILLMLFGSLLICPKKKREKIVLKQSKSRHSQYFAFSLLKPG